MVELDHLRSALADRYRVEGEIGHGGMATVYLAQDLKHERRVAIKVLRPDLASMLGPERFLREIQIEAGLQHVNILPIHDSGEAGGFLYYVMPYVEGESLRARIDREKQLPLDEALHITHEIAEALSYAHDHGIVHRDIKPENILLSGGHAVLADFGIARAIDVAGGERVTQSGHAVGTPHYMSPEQAGGEPDLDGRSDLYSLACVLYEMLAGEPPFTGRTAQAVIARHMAESPPPLLVVRPSVSPRVGEAIERALAKTPADRFATAWEFLTTLETPADSAVYPEPPQPLVLRFLRELRRRMVLHVGLAYLAVAWLAMEFVGTLAERAIIERWVAPVLLFVLAVGLLIILALAWTQEAAAPSQTTTQKRPLWRRWAERTRPAHLLTLLGALAIALLAGQRFVGSESGRDVLNPLRIAVLPFEDQSQPEKFRHLALVFPEYLIDQLSRIGALTVLPYAAVKGYSANEASVDSVVRELKSGTFIEGTLLGSEEEICVFVRLNDANDMALIHSRRHCQPQGEVLALLDMLTADVSGALRQRLGVVVRDLERRAGTDSDEAWDSYARGREWAEDAKRLWQAGAPETALETYERADSAFAQAQSIDPDWVDPIIERGWVAYYNSQILKENLRARDPAMLRRGIELASNALELDSLSARALDLRGTLRYWLRETVSDVESVELRQAAEQDLLAATAIDPTSAHAWHFLSNVLRAAGRHADAKLAAEQALEADQFYEERELIFARLCVTSLDNRQWDEVTRWCGAGRREFPRYYVLLNAELMALASAGGPEDVDTAWQLLEDFLDSNPPQERPALRPTATLYVAAVLARAGLADSAQAVIRQARAAELAPQPMSDYNEAYVWLLLGDREQALQRLQRYLEATPAKKGDIAADWWFEPLRSDPRFQELVR